LNAIEPGYNPENLLMVQYFLPSDKYKEPSQVAAFYRQAGEQLKTIPGVQSVGGGSAGPQFGGYESIEFVADGHQVASSDTYPRARYYDVGPNYFRTMQIPILRGREFSDADNESTPKVAIINQTLATNLWPNESAVGKRVTIVRSNRALEIVGVVGDVKRFGLDAQVEPEIYWPYLQQPRWATYFAIRTDMDSPDVIAAARSRIQSIDSDVLLSNASTMSELVKNSLKRPRFNMLLFAVFAALALLLASIGIYGVISYSVTQRTHEIGVRMALGAQSSDIFRLVLRQGVALAIIGVAAGILASAALTRILESWLFGVSATDPVTIAAVSAFLVAVAVSACYVPARRAMKVDPMVALRYE
jgi:putative ABC transport system permease protein